MSTDHHPKHLKFFPTSVFADWLQTVKESSSSLSQHVLISLFCFADQTQILQMTQECYELILLSWQTCSLILHSLWVVGCRTETLIKTTEMPNISINYKTVNYMLFAAMLFSIFPLLPSLSRQPKSSKRQKYAGRKIILRSWFHVQFAQWYIDGLFEA